MITPEEVRAKTPYRFWKKIKFEEPNECWEWCGTKKEHGYGYYSLTPTGINKRTTGSTRFIYEAVFGAFDKKLHCLHSCDNPPCVNPNHLRIGTHQDNMRDRDLRGRSKPNQVKGSRQALSRLTEKDVVDIKMRLIRFDKQQQIADEYGVSDVSISNIRKGKTWKHIMPEVVIPFRGRAHKLTDEKVRQIKIKLSAPNSNQTEIANEFVVSNGLIWHIAHGKFWTHVKI